MKKLQGYEDSDFEDFPNEKLLWLRLGACVLVGLAIATGLFIGVVMLINKLLEQ